MSGDLGAETPKLERMRPATILLSSSNQVHAPVSWLIIIAAWCRGESHPLSRRWLGMGSSFRVSHPPCRHTGHRLPVGFPDGRETQVLRAQDPIADPLLLFLPPWPYLRLAYRTPDINQAGQWLAGPTYRTSWLGRSSVVVARPPWTVRGRPPLSDSPLLSCHLFLGPCPTVKHIPVHTVGIV